MAYAAMNRFADVPGDKLTFLNGVCRHEPFSGSIDSTLKFLNGVCRHEL